MPLSAEFPTFDATSLPAIPEGFVDVSWHNDACPSFENGALRLRIYVDFPLASDREYPEMPRYSVHRIADDLSTVDEILATDDWSDVVGLIDTLNA